MTMRVAIPEDIEHDPTFARQRFVMRYLLGALINQLRDCRPLFLAEIDDKKLADQAEAIARQYGIIPAADEDLRHAPMCPSNRWSGSWLPTAPCSCGAEKEGRGVLIGP